MPSPFAHLLDSTRPDTTNGSTAAPTLGPENQTLNQHIQLLRQDLRISDSQIDDVEGLLRWLRQDRAKIRHQIDAHIGLSPPVNRLPPEILSNIFFFALETPVRVFDLTGGPWSLALVCRQWRTIVLESPRLWTSIEVATSGDLRHAYARAPAFITDILGRSKSAPLDVSLDIRWDTQHLVPTIVPVSERIEVFSVRGHWYRISRQIARSFTCLPALSSMDISLVEEEEDEDEEDDEASTDALSTEMFPRLKYLLIEADFDIALPPSIAKLPCGQLTELEISLNGSRLIDLPTTLEILGKCPKLTSFIDHSNYGFAPMYMSHQANPVVLRLVEVLGLSSPALMSCITCPALQVLTLPSDPSMLAGIVKPNSGRLDIYGVEFMQRSQCQALDEVNLTPLAVDDNLRTSFRAMLRTVTRIDLETLDYQDEPLTAPFVALFKHGADDGQSFAPKASLLTFSLSATPHVVRFFAEEPEQVKGPDIETVILEVVESRFRAWKESGQSEPFEIQLIYRCPDWVDGTSSTSTSLTRDKVLRAVYSTPLCERMHQLRNEGLSFFLDCSTAPVSAL